MENSPGRVSPSSIQAVLLDALAQVKADLSQQIAALSARLDKVDDRAMTRTEAERRLGEHDDRLKQLERWQLQQTGQAGDWRYQLQGQVAGVEQQALVRQATQLEKREDRMADWLKWGLGVGIGMLVSLFMWLLSILPHLSYHP